MAASTDALVRELGAGLRAARKAAGWTLRGVQDLTGINNATVSQWETGTRVAPLDRLITVLDALKVAPDERERLLGLRREIDGPGQMVAGAPSIGEPLDELVAQERIASRITVVSSLVIPGLLQTEDVARAILAGPDDVETRVALRMGRQRVLTRDERPVELHALIDREVMSRPIVPPTMMAGQLRHLLRMAERPNITIQVVSSTKTGYSPHLAGSFVVIEFPSASPIVHLEHYSAATTLWETDEVATYMAAAKTVAERAMTPARTAEVIENIVKGMEHRDDEDDTEFH